MKIFVKLKPSTSKNLVEQIDATHYVVSVTAPPMQGKANTALLELLANHLKMPRSLLSIKRGANSKQKTIEISTSQALF